MSFIRVLSVAVFPLPPLSVYYSSIVLEKKAGASSVFHLTITEYCMSSVNRFLVVASEDAVSYQSSDPCLFHSSRGFFVPLLGRLHTHFHNYRFRHLIDGSVFNYSSALIAFKCSAEVHWTPCELVARW